MSESKEGLTASLELIEADRQARLARPLRTFRLLNEHGFGEDVQAATWEVSHGTLIFRGNGGEAFRAIAPGSWSEVRDS